MGLNNVSILQHIIRDKRPSGFQQTQNIRHKMNILSFCGIHKDQIKRLGECRKDFRCIPFKQCNLLFFSCSLKIFPGNRDSLFIIFNRDNLTRYRIIFCHQNGRKPYRSTDFQNSFWFCHRQQKLQKALHLLPNNRNIGIQSFSFDSIQNSGISRIQGIDICYQSFIYYHIYFYCASVLSTSCVSGTICFSAKKRYP